MRKHQFIKVKDSLLELEKGFKELKDREVNIKKEIEGLFLKPIIASIDDMSRSEKKGNGENKTS